MIITRTPLRISFLGGGTDYPEHFRQHGGQTFGAAIDKFSYLTVKRLVDLFDYSIRVNYSRTELVSSVDQIKHPAVRACLDFLKLTGGIEISYVGDLPARTGLGSSSSFTVGLLYALHAFKGEMVDAQELAAEAVYVEQELIGELVGVQDQYLCAHGGIAHLQCYRQGKIALSPVPLSSERLANFQSHLMLFYTGISRFAQEILGEQLEQTTKGVLANDLHQLSDLVDQGLELLFSDKPIACFGELLHAGWVIKRKLSSKISSSQIDNWYMRARNAGAIGGKLLGAGGGGFLLLLAKPEAHSEIRRQLSDLKQVSFNIEPSGSQLWFYRKTN